MCNWSINSSEILPYEGSRECIQRTCTFIVNYHNSHFHCIFYRNRHHQFYRLRQCRRHHHHHHHSHHLFLSLSLRLSWFLSFYCLYRCHCHYHYHNHHHYHCQSSYYCTRPRLDHHYTAPEEVLAGYGDYRSSAILTSKHSDMLAG